MGIIVSDSFNRANGAIGTADTGQTWATTNGGSSYSISSNQVAPALIGSAQHTPCVIDAGKSDGIVSCDYASSVSGTGLVFRLVDDANFWLVLVFDGTMYKKVAGSYTFVASVTAGNGTWTAELDGTSIVVKNNGVQQASVTDSFNQTGTKHGFSSVNSNTQRYDNFSFITPSAPPYSGLLVSRLQPYFG